MSGQQLAERIARHMTPMEAQDAANRIAAQIEHFRGIIAMMNPESRVLVFSRMQASYCRDCGNEIGDGVCHCQNDE